MYSIAEYNRAPKTMNKDGPFGTQLNNGSIIDHLWILLGDQSGMFLVYRVVEPLGGHIIPP